MTRGTGAIHSDLAGDARPERLVYVVDDDADVRRSLHFALATSNITTWPFASPFDFLDQLEILRPGPILLDYRMPELDGVQVLLRLKDRGNSWPVIMMSAHGEIPIAVRAMQLGAIDFLQKPYSMTDLEDMLEASFLNLTEITRADDAKSSSMALLETLTKREREVLTFLSQGLSNKLIAREMKISPRTVEVYRSNVYAKMGIKSTAEVVRMTFDTGQIASKT